MRTTSVSTRSIGKGGSRSPNQVTVATQLPELVLTSALGCGSELRSFSVMESSHLTSVLVEEPSESYKILQHGSMMNK